MNCGTVSKLKSANNVNKVEATLLEGQFSSEQAAQQLHGILGKCIQHHWVQSFNDLSGMDESSQYSDKKMLELSQLRGELIAKLNEAEKNGSMIDIQASISVNIISNKKLNTDSDKIAS